MVGEGSSTGYRAAADGLASLALLALPGLLYGGALDLWWTHDDFFQIRYTLAHAPWEYSLDPEIWRLLPNRVLSPLLFASYDLDLALVGLDPAHFYGHQLLSLGLAALALYATLRLWLAPPWALLGGASFLLGPPVASLAPLLMVRHYPEALFLGLLSTWVFVLAVPRRGPSAWGLAALSGLLYLAAALAKEIAVPLPALLPLLPAGMIRRRLPLLAPHAGVLVVYALYRFWMLGTPLGGYGWAVLPGEWPGLALRFPGEIARELAGPSPWGWVALVGFTGAVLALAHRSRHAAALVFAGLLAALLPVLPVAMEVAPRYAAAAWLLLAAAFAPAARLLATGGLGPSEGWPVCRARIAVAVGLTLLLAAALAGNREAWTENRGRAARMSVENRGFLELGAGELLRQPLGPPASMAELRRFAREVLDRPAEGGWFYDDLYLCESKAPVRALWTYDPALGRLEDVTAELGELRRSHCGSIRWDAPLEAAFSYRSGGVLSWELGPYPEGPAGGYAFLLDDGRIRYEVPRRGAFQVGGQSFLGLRVRFESPEGWVTYSPLLDLHPSGASGGSVFRWVRPQQDARGRGIATPQPRGFDRACGAAALAGRTDWSMNSSRCARAS